MIYIFACLQLVACSSALNLTAPQLTFVNTHVANLSSQTGKVRYLMRYELTNDAPGNLFARVHYQDLSNKDLFHTTSIGALGEAKFLNFNSMPDSQIINKRYFEIILILYKDPEYRQALGIHRELLWFDMPETVAEGLENTML